MLKQKTYYELDVQNCPQHIHDALFDLGADWCWNKDSIYTIEAMTPEDAAEEYDLESYKIVCQYLQEVQVPVGSEILVHYWW